MLRVVSNAEMVEQENAAAEEEQKRVIEMFTDNLSSRIRRQWEVNKSHKSKIEGVLQECQRSRNNQYDPDVQAEIKRMGGSDIYLPLTQMQCVAASAWLTDILMPAGDKPWSLDPTPEPEIDEKALENIKRQFYQEVQQAQQQGIKPQMPQMMARIDELAEKEKSEIAKMVAKASDKMERKIEDQLVDSEWSGAFEDFIDDFTTYPTAFIETSYQRKSKLKWQRGKPVMKQTVCEIDRRVSPYDVFPSPEQIEIDEGNLIIRKRLPRSEIYGLISVPGYREDKIRQVLMEYDQGYKEWGLFEKEQDDWFADKDGLIEALHYWGSAQGTELMEWGIPVEQIEDPLAEYQIEAILIGRHVIKACINSDPLDRRPYYKASYRNRPGHFWGIAIPQLLRGHQRMANASARALSNNMGISSGPQIITLIDRLPEGEEIEALYPWKNWQMTSDPNGNTQSPIQFFQPDSNAQELLGVLTHFWEQAADVTGVSKMSYGIDQRMPQGAQTAMGIAIMSENAAKTIKEAVRHVDEGVIEKRILRQFHWNMLYEPDEDIKGDIAVVARGSSAMIAKAANQARRNEFMQLTNNPVDMQILGLEGRTDLLRQVVNDLDMDVRVPTFEELQQKQQQAAQQGQQQDPAVEKEKIRMQSRLEDQKMEMQDRERERQLKIMLAKVDDQRERDKLRLEYESAVHDAQAKYQQAILAAQNKRQVIADEAQIKAQFGSGI